MKNFVLLAIFVGGSLPALTGVSVARLEQMLNKDSATHKSDPEMTRETSTMVPTERLTESSLNRIASNLPLDAQSQNALHLLADESAFLLPRESELPKISPPDDATKSKGNAGYWGRTWHRLRADSGFRQEFWAPGDRSPFRCNVQIGAMTGGGSLSDQSKGSDENRPPIPQRT